MQSINLNLLLCESHSNFINIANTSTKFRNITSPSFLRVVKAADSEVDVAHEPAALVQLFLCKRKLTNPSKLGQVYMDAHV